MAERRHDVQVHRTVRRVRNYWYRAGVPRRIRRDEAEELRSHLLGAVDDGRGVEEVVGSDVAAFASEWAQAAILGVLLVAAYTVLFVLVVGPGHDTEVFVELPSGVAATLVILGATTQSAASWLKRRR